MLKFPWLVIKYAIALPVLVILLFFGFLQPVSKSMSLLPLPETMVEGLSAFSAFGDYTAKHISAYRGYYNIWLPEEEEIEPVKRISLP